MILPGWKYRRKITISHENIDADLTHFPLLLKLGSSVGLSSANVTSIFDKVGANLKKVAITKDDGISQIYTEIERWDATNKLAELWTSKNDLVIPSSQDTSLYFYYDNSHADNTTYIGDVAGSSPATNVWDANHKFVSHMKDDPDTSHIKDSTSNGNNGTKYAANESIEADGQIAGAQNFDESDDKITIGTTGRPTNTFAFGGWIKALRLAEGSMDIFPVSLMKPLFQIQPVPPLGGKQITILKQTIW